MKSLKRTQDFGLKYSKVDDFNLIGYFDLEFDGDKETVVSTLGYVTSLGSIDFFSISHKRELHSPTNP